MDCSFLASIRCFKLSDIDSYDLEFALISNPNIPFLQKIIGPEFLASFGRDGAVKFQSKWAFIYWGPSDSVTDLDKADYQFGVYQQKMKTLVYQLDTFLWFIKDNSCNITNIYALAKTGKNFGQLSFEYKKVISNCCGEFADVSFSKDEIDECLEIRKKFYEICPNFKDEDHWGYDREVNRIEKGFKFLYEARHEVYLPSKIAMYMSCFECLFAVGKSDGGELTQKIAERASFYIGNYKEDKIEIYRTIKMAYNIRSRYLHGGELDEAENNRTYQSKISTKTDAIARRIFTKIITEDSDYFLKGDFGLFASRLIFKDSPPAPSN